MFCSSFLTCMATALFLSACMIEGGGGGNKDGTPTVPKMVSIRATGKSFHQGSTSSSAALNERPAMMNSFTYDFFMDSTEVTQADFKKIMGWDPVPATSVFGRGENYPVFNLTWFDAALYCNARSKQNGLDTVYVYSGREQEEGASTYSLSGLVTRLNVKGFRLPTEAEWEFAAKAENDSDFSWGGLGDSAHAMEYSWFNRNANGTAHPVAGLKPNAFGLYDMAGNVMEWVNDWKGAYPKAGSEDFTGSRDPGPAFEVPVKGGAFKYGMNELRAANRSSTYTTIRSSKAEYVGFRCALGPILHPHYSTTDGYLSETDEVHLNITRIQNLVAGRSAKLVFVNANQSVRHLAYINYNENPVRIREFADVGKVFYPVISPDGNWVAFGSAVEGSSTGSTLYMRSLNDSATSSQVIGQGFIPRWWVSPVARDTFLIYTNSAMDNSQANWAGTLTLMQLIRGGQPIGAPTILTEGGYHDGRSKDGKWLATGYKFLKLFNSNTGTSQTLFTAPENGKALGDTSQVCNVSMAPDSSGRTIFLDFGYDAKSTLTGFAYNIHQLAFMAEPEGRVQKWYKSPANETGWEDFEWSNQVSYAISSATDAQNGHHHIYLINLRDSITSLLASGTQVSTPNLWLGDALDSIPLAGLKLDSLGHYDDPATDDYQSVYSSRMVLFWKQHSSLELIFTGSSHGYSGIDAHQITKLRPLNMCYPANGWLGQEEWVSGYALNHCPKLKVLVMEVFPGWLYFPNGDFTWESKISRTKGMQYDQSNQYWKSGVPYRFEELVSRAPNSTKFNNDSVGFAFQPTVDWGGAATVPLYSEWGLDDKQYQATMLRIEKFAKTVADRKIHLILLNYPTSPAYKSSQYYGSYGPRKSVGKLIVDRLRNMENISPYVHFYDAYNFGNHDYTDADAANSGHLSTHGAIRLTARIDSLVNTLP